MVFGTRLRRQAQRMGGALLFAFPACSASRDDLADRPAPPPSFLATGNSITNLNSTTIKSVVVPASAAGAYPRAACSPRTQSRNIAAVRSVRSVDRQAAADQPADRPRHSPTPTRSTSRSPSERLRAAAAQLDRARCSGCRTSASGSTTSATTGRSRTSSATSSPPAGRRSWSGPGRPRSSRWATPSTPRSPPGRSSAPGRPTCRRPATTARSQVAEAYFTVQQARGEVAGSVDALRRAEELVKRTEKLAPDWPRPSRSTGRRTELARRRQAVEAAYERWQVASADLTRLLRLDPGTAGRAGRGAAPAGRTDRPGLPAGRPDPGRPDQPPGTGRRPGAGPGDAGPAAAGEGPPARAERRRPRRRVATRRGCPAGTSAAG